MLSNVGYCRCGYRRLVSVRLVRFSSSVSVSFNKVGVVVVLVKHVQGICFHHISCPVYRNPVVFVSSECRIALCEVGGPVICRFSVYRRP